MDDVISRQDVLDIIEDLRDRMTVECYWSMVELVKALTSTQPDVLACGEGELSAQPEIVRCKDCKHWKDSDGVYRRGINAESKCPVNIRAVYEGNFYCADAERRTDG